MNARFTSLNRYSSWDGSQNTTLDADDILSALSEDLMEFGSEVRVLSPECLATRIRSGLERVVQVHA